MSALGDQARSLMPPRWSAPRRNLGWLLAGLGGALGLHFLFGTIDQPFYAKLTLDIGIAIVLAVSLNIVNGFTGQFSMGHAGFMAVGGYVAAAITFYGSIKLFGSAVPFRAGDPDAGLLSWNLDLSRLPEGTGLLGRGDVLFVGACLIGGLAAAGAGYLVGLPSLRLRGDYLAIVTLGFGEIVRVLFQSSGSQVKDGATVVSMPPWELATRLGRATGFNTIPMYTSLFWTFLVVAITIMVAYRLKYSSTGRALLSIREDEVAAEAMGIHTTRYKVRAFVLASFFAGIAGALFAHQNGSINAAGLGFIRSFDIIIMIVLGGLGSISGAVLAAIVLTLLPEALRAPPTLFSPLGFVVVALTVGAVWVFANRKGRGILVVFGVFVAWESIRRVALWQGIELSDYRMIAYSLLLILMMILRPKGLLGIHELWELAPTRRALRWGRDQLERRFGRGAAAPGPPGGDSS